MLESLLNGIDLVETVKLVYNLPQDGLTIADQQVEEFLVLFDIVSLLLTNDDGIVAIGRIGVSTILARSSGAIL